MTTSGSPCPPTTTLAVPPCRLWLILISPRGDGRSYQSAQLCMMDHPTRSRSMMNWVGGCGYFSTPNERTFRHIFAGCCICRALEVIVTIIYFCFYDLFLFCSAYRLKDSPMFNDRVHIKMAHIKIKLSLVMIVATLLMLVTTNCKLKATFFLLIVLTVFLLPSRTAKIQKPLQSVTRLCSHGHHL